MILNKYIFQIKIHQIKNSRRQTHCLVCRANNMALIKLPGDCPLMDTWCPWKHLYSTSIFFSLVLASRAGVCPSSSTSLNPMPFRAAEGCKRGSESRVIIGNPLYFEQELRWSEILDKERGSPWDLSILKSLSGE